MFVRVQDKLVSFFETPQSPRALGFLRIAVSALCIVQALWWLPDWEAFIGRFGWIQWEITQALKNPWEVHIEDVSVFLAKFGIEEEQSLYIFLWTYIGALSFLAIGLLTRMAAIMAWFCHFIILASIPTFFYGLDIFIHISLFYLMIFPVSKAYSVDAALGWVSTVPSWSVGMSMRVLQIHLCFVYLSAGFGKIWNADWWNGNIIWHSLNHSFFQSPFDMTWIGHFSFIPMFLGWWTLFLETLYPIGMWIPKLRVFWLINIILLHFGIIIFLGLWLFGSIMIILSLAAFGQICWQDVRKQSHFREKSGQ